MHFFHCPSSQGQFICHHNHIREAIMDQIGDSVDNQPSYRGRMGAAGASARPPAHAPPTTISPSGWWGDGGRGSSRPRFAKGEEDGFIEEGGRIRKQDNFVYHRPSAAQHRGQSRRAAPRRPRSLRGRLSLNRERGYGRRNRTLLSPTTPTAASILSGRTSPSPAKNRPPQAPAGCAAAVTTSLEASCPRLPGKSFAIEHRVRAKMTKFRPLLGGAVDDPKRARMALRWVRFLRHPI